MKDLQKKLEVDLISFTSSANEVSEFCFHRYFRLDPQLCHASSSGLCQARSAALSVHKQILHAKIEGQGEGSANKVVGG